MRKFAKQNEQIGGSPPVRTCAVLPGCWGLAEANRTDFGETDLQGAVVLSPGEIPTTDLYLKRRLKAKFGDAVQYVNTLQTTPDGWSAVDKIVVIVRHAPRRWRQWLKQHRDQFAGVVYLIDDDMASALRAWALPWRYALKTRWRYANTWRTIGQFCSEVWFSTPELIKRYPSRPSRLVQPEYVAPTVTEEKPLVYFYHGSWAHQHEIKWLPPIVRQVQQTVPNAWFEIMGTDRVKRLFCGIPRVRVVHPMPWADYLAYAGTVRYQVGLAPCFDSHFNRARSHSKMFDITRLGAAGIYSNVTPYKEKVVHGETGLLCANDPEQWTAAIIRLLNTGELRESLFKKAMAWCKEGHQETMTEARTGCANLPIET